MQRLKRRPHPARIRGKLATQLRDGHMATMPFTPCSTNQCTDVTVNILQTVFGSVIHNLTLGADPSGADPALNVIATMMGYFNSGVLTIATLIVSFVTVVGVINTANDGEAFGRNWSSLWTPVRIVSGAFLFAYGYGIFVYSAHRDDDFTVGGRLCKWHF